MPKSSAAPKSTKSKKTAVKKHPPKSAASAPATETTEPRVLPGHQHVWYKPWTWFSRLPAPPRKPLPKARVLTKMAASRLWHNKKLFGGLVLIYGVIDVLLVRGLSSSVDLNGFKQSLDALLSGAGTDQLFSTVSSFMYLLASSGSSTGSSPYGNILVLLMSLAFIWAMRQVAAGHYPRIRDAFYQGMYPLIPFLLVLFVVSLQLLPMVGGGVLYNAVISHGIAISLWERLIFIALFVVLAFWSLYMMTATLFALYIVTLPDMTPVKAVRSAWQLVYKRRLLIWRKFIFLPIALLLFALVVELPLIFLWPPAAEWAFFVLSMASLAAVHSYLYTLYREML